MGSVAVTSALSESFVIEGGRPLSRSVRVAGNKNAALPIIAACVLTDEPITLSNVPAITDVETMLELAADIGADARAARRRPRRIHAQRIARHELDEELCSRMRLVL